ncbi:MAG: hypothetical protein IJQ39_11860 [Thermoguttaceae bacterium]|nr:hypothetical protein [Thermoguttaceae bacterium]
MKPHSAFLSLLFLALVLPSVYADVVQVEIIQLEGASMEYPHTWGRELVRTDAPAVQFRAQRFGDAVSITEAGTEASPVWKVIGTMDAYGTILMPDGTQFRCGDAAGLATWIRELPGKMKAKKQAENAPVQGDFGLPVRLQQQMLLDLKQNLQEETAGLTPVEILQKCARGLSAPFRISPAQVRALKELDPIDEELSSLSKGTIIAYLLRPAGLALVPRQSNGRLYYSIETGQKNVKPWPIGMKVDKLESEVLPDILKKIPANMRAVPLRDAVDSISERIDVPMLYDLNAMARYGIDHDLAKVTVTAEKITYLSLLNRVLRMHKLKAELRMDENGEPFFWITTTRPL